MTTQLVLPVAIEHTIGESLQPSNRGSLFPVCRYTFMGNGATGVSMIGVLSADGGTHIATTHLFDMRIYDNMSMNLNHNPMRWQAIILQASDGRVIGYVQQGDNEVFHHPGGPITGHYGLSVGLSKQTAYKSWSFRQYQDDGSLGDIALELINPHVGINNETGNIMTLSAGLLFYLKLIGNR